MLIRNDWWTRQFIESLKETSLLHDRFKKALQPNVEDIDKAIAIYEECCYAYDLKEIFFEEFTEFGKSLRARQAFSDKREGFICEP